MQFAAILLGKPAEAEAAAYPSAPRRTMPTRLGNALRRYEDDLGRQYGLKGLQVAPHLSMSAAAEHDAYLGDTRTQMDVAIRLCGLFLLATPMTALLLAGSGWWVLGTLFPYLVSYVSYRGAVASAHSYGSALFTLMDLDRFQLYAALHLPLPVSTLEERRQNAHLMELLRGSETASVSYQHGEQVVAPTEVAGGEDLRRPPAVDDPTERRERGAGERDTSRPNSAGC